MKKIIIRETKEKREISNSFFFSVIHRVWHGCKWIAILIIYMIGSWLINSSFVNLYKIYNLNSTLDLYFSDLY